MGPQTANRKFPRTASSRANRKFPGNFSQLLLSPPLHPVEAAVDRQYEELVLRRTAGPGFRTCGLLQVAEALIPGCDTFWSFDEKANALAALEVHTARPAVS